MVPVDGQHWTSDPWTVTERDGRLYGRGTCDMKGFVALALAAVPVALAAALKRPLQLAISYDEELGCTGAPPLIAAMAGLPKAGAVVVGEPSRMKVVTGHKGGCAWKFHLRGHEVHSSLLPQGVSAIMEAARLIQWANDRNAALQAAPRGPVAAAFDPPFSTLHAGMINGGTAHNITAADCRFALEVRAVPGESLLGWISEVEGAAQSIAAAMAAQVPGTGIDIDRYFELDPPGPRTARRGRGTVPPPDGRQRRACRQLWHRGGAFPEGRVFLRGLRSRRHRAGPSG